MIGELAPAATDRDNLLRSEAQLRLERLATVRALSFLRTPMNPVMMSVGLLAILPDADVTEAGFTGEVQT